MTILGRHATGGTAGAEDPRPWMPCGDAVIGKETIKSWLAGTPLDAPARALYRALVAATATQPAASAPVAPHVTLNARYDAQTVAVMARVLAPGSNCIDVGCHHGKILDAMLRFAAHGAHFAFEPLPDLLRARREVCERPHRAPARVGPERRPGRGHVPTCGHQSGLQRPEAAPLRPAQRAGRRDHRKGGKAR